MEHYYRLGAESVVGKVVLRDWRALQFDTQPGISQLVQDEHDADGMGGPSAIEGGTQPQRHSSDSAEEEQLAQREEELIQQKVNDVMTSSER